MRTIRMDSELERRLQRAAAVAGESVSEFVRQATTARVDVVLRDDVRVEFTDVIGAVRGAAVHGGRGQAGDTGAAFADIVAARAGQAARSAETRHVPAGTA